MCGITGFVQLRGDLKEEVLKEMTETLAHRGPDHEGYWCDHEVGVALGHKRLSILDLSKEGHQPMFSASGRYAVVYNGEIYNFKSLRKELEEHGASFRGESDTEVLLAAIEKWGVKEAVLRFNGMFAFGLWDREERKLYLIRDRIGIKPLYYGWTDEAFLFGSELKPFSKHPSFPGEVSRSALRLFVRRAYVPSPHSIYEGIYKLEAGCILCLDMEQLTNGEDGFSPYRDSEGLSPKSYWNVVDVFAWGDRYPFIAPKGETILKLESVLREAVKCRLVSDVPLGAFLSGGVDSSLIVALMQAESSGKVKTFSIGFNEKEYNEAKFAKEVAGYLKTDHTELYVSPEEVMEVLPKLPVMYDEPFGDFSQLPTFLVSKLAREEVTVSLSGDGGDELFCGYSRYLQADSIAKKMRWCPPGLRRSIGGLIKVLGPGAWDRVFGMMGKVLPGYLHSANRGYKMHKLAGALSAPDTTEFYSDLLSHWTETDLLVPDGEDLKTAFMGVKGECFLDHMMITDLLTYLPDDILVKLDRASMAVSLEGRVPLLDHNVIEFAASLPTAYKVRRGMTKRAFRDVLYRYVPKGLIERPKKGFSFPIGEWLRGDLKDWAEDLLEEKKIKEQGYFNPEMVRKHWDEHLSGERNWQYQLWDVLAFQSWVEDKG